MSALAPADLGKLAKVCGLFASNHVGERAAAAAQADRIVKQSGLSWEELLSRLETSRRREVSPSPGTILARHGELLTGWEKGFLSSLVRLPQSRWSRRQTEVLADIQRRFS